MKTQILKLKSQNHNPKIKKFLLLMALIIALGAGFSAPVLAQDPTSWQNTATGLSVTQNDEQKTAGLGFIIKVQDWPFLSLRGGVEDAGSYRGSKVDGPVGIELGQIRIPGSSGTFSSETVDWAHNEMTFAYGGASELKLWASRLSPAILFQSQANSLTFFTGHVSGNTFDGSSVTSRPDGPSYPKYVAYSSDGSVQVQSLSTSATSLSSLDQNWILLWYGEDSHFVDTKMPLSYSWTVPHENAYQADTPLLLVFENLPTAIKHSTEGGIDLSFSGAADHLTILPLYGRDTLRASETETWAQGLPSDVLQKAQWWANHLCSYPVSVSETYAYDGGSDIATITESITFLSACSGGIQFAPIPPMLGLVKDSLGVSFSGPLVDGHLFTEFGPMLGLENTQEYSWSVSGLEKYVDAKRIVIDSGQAPNELEQELASEVQKIIAAGHFAPWIFLDSVPRHTLRGDLYWGNPADTLYHLIEAAEAINDTDLKSNLINYIQSERTAYPPEDVFNLDPNEGTIRGEYSYLDSWTLSVWSEDGLRQDAVLKDVPLSTFYSLARYYDLTQETLPAQVWPKAQEALDRDMREQDWATFYWFDGFEDRRIAVRNANRHFAGLVGYVRLAQIAGDTQAENLGRALLAKAAVLRLGMAQYPRYLYSTDLVELSPEPDWQPQYIRHPNIGYLYNYDWTGPYDDARQVATLDQFEVYLHDHSGSEPGGGITNAGSGSAHLTGFRDLVPEQARFLADFAKQDVEIYINKVEALFPHWYASFAEAALGQEHNLFHPINSFQIFMAKALIQGQTPQKLTTYLDIPWLQEGDLFHLHKLAETIKAYRGMAWSDTVSLKARPGDQSIYLTWSVYNDLPPGITWQIDYQSHTGTLYTPITGIISPTRAYTLTGLTNYVWYTVTLSGMSGDAALLTSDPVRVMPTDRFIYLPLILKEF